jgi:hypothetical protein
MKKLSILWKHGKIETYKIYLLNALSVIQERNFFDDKMLREYALTELGINEQDFDAVMGNEYGKE